MRSRTTRSFWARFDALPEPVKTQARKAYELWRTDPHHPSLRFKRIHKTEPLYSLRISRDDRALGLRTGDTLTWFWVGSHADYDKLLSQWEAPDAGGGRQSPARSGQPRGGAGAHPLARCASHCSKRFMSGYFASCAAAAHTGRPAFLWLSRNRFMSTSRAKVPVSSKYFSAE